MKRSQIVTLSSIKGTHVNRTPISLHELHFDFLYHFLKKCELVRLSLYFFLLKAQKKNKLLVNSSHLLRYPYSENTTLTSTYEGG